MASASSVTRAVWTGGELLAAFRHAAALLDHHRDAINALNVFPVPDGDTGTNMALTMRGAMEATAELPDDSHASTVATKLAYGALMSARGNSGVILSQVFRGFASGLDGADEVDGRDIARALRGAQDTAYKAVMRPVEGTMLTVVRGAADRAAAVSKGRPALVDVLRAAVEGAQTALDGTPEQLAILKQAGVVDAGGQGVVHIIAGLLNAATGDTALPSVAEPGSANGVGGGMTFLDDIDMLHGEDAFGYCTNFMVFADAIDVDACREALSTMGESAVVVGDETVLKVHIHTTDPGGVLAWATALGDLDQIKIDNMSRQTDALTAQREGQRSRAAAHPADTLAAMEPDDPGAIAIIAVAAGDGIAAALRSMGVSAIVRGGQSMNPSTQEMLEAVEGTSATEVILLPNNRNILLAANQVDGLTAKTVRVVPTRSLPDALAALTVFNTDSDLDDNHAAMIDAVGDTVAISVTRAVRDVEIDGMAVCTGQTIGLLNDVLTSVGSDDLDVVLHTIASAGIADPDLVTVFVGEDVRSGERETFAEGLARTWPGAEVEIHAGGQPHYRYIVSVE